MSDTSMVALTKTINQIGEAFEAFKSTNDERIEAVKKGKDSLAAEISEKLGRIDASLAAATKAKADAEKEMELQRERIEELEARHSSPGKTALAKAEDEHLKAFVGWMRAKGQSPVHESKLDSLTKRVIELKTDTIIGTPSLGGYAVPEQIAREIERLEKKFSPVRNLVKVVQVGTSDYKELVNIRGATSGWVGESGSRTATNVSALREVVPTHGELYAYPQASEWSLDDIFFNVEAWLAEEVAQSFAIDEGDAVIRGNGSSKPTGMLQTAPTSRDDFDSPIRDPKAYQFVTDGDSPYTVDGDTLIGLVYKLNSAYRANGTFVFNSATAGFIRKLKVISGDQQYLWQPGLQMGQPDRLLGYPIAIWEQMDDLDVSGGGNATYPVAFGDFRRGYVLADRVGLRVTRDNVTNVGFVRFYVRRREGGIVLNNDAIKWIKTAA